MLSSWATSSRPARGSTRRSSLLEAVGAVGVFGNHDYGLSVDPSEYRPRGRFSPSSLAYMGSLLPRMELDGCLFAHREPWLDCDPGRPDLARRRGRPPLVDDRQELRGRVPSFDLHRPFPPLASLHARRPLAWDGSEPLALPDHSPMMIVVGAICDGHAAIFDTETRVLTPIDLYANQIRPEYRPIPRLVTE